MPLAPDRFQPRFGYTEQPQAMGQTLQNATDPLREQRHPFWDVLEGLVGSFRGMQTSRANPSLFHEPTVTAGAGFGQGLSAAGNILDDPRNAWIGLGPLAAMARFRRVPHFGTDAGGFNVPTSRMLRQDTGMARTPELFEQDKRADYFFGRRLENAMAEALQDETHEFHREAMDRYKQLLPEDRSRVEQVLRGQAALEGEKTRTKASTAGGAAPPPWFKPKVGNVSVEDYLAWKKLHEK